METSLILAKEITKLFIIMAMGWTLVKARILRTEDSRVISAVLVYIVIPCVIIGAFQIEHSPYVIRGLIFSFVMAIGTHALFLLLAAIFGVMLKLDTAERLTVVYTNAGILVIPLVQAILGDKYIVYSCSFIVVQIILLWTHCRKVLNGRVDTKLRDIFLNINVISIIAGCTMFLTEVNLPSVIDDTIKMTGSMMGPLGMILAGMVIANVPAHSIFCHRRRYIATTLRLVVAPLILLLAFKICDVVHMIPDGYNILLVVFLAGITPACATVTSMAQLYSDIGDRTGILYVLTTLLSIFTIPLIIGFFSVVI